MWQTGRLKKRELTMLPVAGLLFRQTHANLENAPMIHLGH
jgi:hypothetical protein